MESLGTVKLSFVNMILKRYRSANKGKRDCDIDIPAEVLIPSCFPELYKNFEKNVSEQYTKGYLDGLKEGQNNVD